VAVGTLDPALQRSGRARPPLRASRASRRAWGYAFALPAVIFIGIFLLYPIVEDIYLSFTNYSVIAPAHWIGLANYRYLFDDGQFGQAVLNTVYFVFVAVPAQIALGLLLAVLLDEKLRGRRLFRTIFFIPLAISQVAAGLVFKWLFAATPNVGLVGGLVDGIGLHYPAWSSTAGIWAMPLLLLINTWMAAGFVMILYLVGLQAINPSYYEAASIDGAASRWSQFRHVTWPLLRPTTILLVISTTIFSFQMFSLSDVVSGGGPAGATTTLVYFAYEQFPALAGVGAAVTSVLLLFAIVVATIQVLVLRKVEVYV